MADIVVRVRFDDATGVVRGIDTIDDGTDKARAGFKKWRKESDKTFRSMEKGAVRARSSIKNLVGALGLVAGLRALSRVGIQALEMAKNVEESENLFAVSLGNMAEDARAWSESVGKSLGLNRFQLRENLGIIFQMTSSMGLSRDAAFGMATGITKLSQDMASFFNLDPEVAFQKLQAGITGEAEPLKRLGILVDEQTSKQAAYTAGIAEYGAELTQTQKVQARYLAILTQTSKVQGDLERTLTSTTNLARRLSSRWAEQQAILGRSLIPTYNVFLGTLGDLLDAGDDLTGNTEDLAAGIGLLGKAWIGFDLVVNETFLLLFKGFVKLERFIASTFRSVANLSIDLPLGIHIGATQESVEFLTTAADALEESANANAASFVIWENHAQDLVNRLVNLNEAILNVGTSAANVANQPPPIPGAANPAATAAALKAAKEAIEFSGRLVPLQGPGPGSLTDAFEKSPALLEQEAAERRARSGITIQPLEPEGPGSLLRPGETIFDPSKQSEFQSFGEGMGEILGNLTDKFGLYQSAIQEAGSAFGAFVRGQASLGQAVKAAVKNTIAALASEALVQSLTELAKGLAALFFNPGQAAGHFASSAAWAAAAAAAGVVGRAIPAGGAAGGGGGAGGGGFGGPGTSPLNPIFVDPFAQSNQFRLQDVNVAGGGGTLDRLSRSLDRFDSMPAGVLVANGVDDAGGVTALVTGGDLRQLTQDVVNDSRI